MRGSVCADAASLRFGKGAVDQWAPSLARIALTGVRDAHYIEDRFSPEIFFCKLQHLIIVVVFFIRLVVCVNEDRGHGQSK